MSENADVVMDKPGKCPKCGMNLVEKKHSTIKYVCPMKEDADVISDKPGKCPKCGMKLVKKLMQKVAKEVVILFEVSGPVGGRRGSKLIGVDAQLVINRQDYNIKFSRTMDSGGFVVSDDVKIEIHVEAVNRPESTN